MLVRSFLIKSSSKLLVTRTGIKARSSLILGRIRPLILKLLALEWRKFHTFELEYLWSQLANLDQILCVASLGWWKGCIRFWGRFDQNTGVHGNRKPHWLIMRKMMSPRFLGCFWSDPFEKTTFDLGTLDSGERSLPFGLLVVICHAVSLWTKTPFLCPVLEKNRCRLKILSQGGSWVWVMPSSYTKWKNVLSSLYHYYRIFFLHPFPSMITFWVCVSHG